MFAEWLDRVGYSANIPCSVKLVIEEAAYLGLYGVTERDLKAIS